MRRKAGEKETLPKSPSATRAGAGRAAFDRGQLQGLVGYHVRRAQIAIFADFARVIGAFEITPGQFGVLTLIHRNAGLNQSELGQAMGVDRSTIVAVIDRLQARGLVERRPAPADRRAHALHLTEAGEALLAKLMPMVQGHEDRLLQGVAARDRAKLIQFLQRIRANLAGSDGD